MVQAAKPSSTLPIVPTLVLLTLEELVVAFDAATSAMEAFGAVLLQPRCGDGTAIERFLTKRWDDEGRLVDAICHEAQRRRPRSRKEVDAKTIVLAKWALNGGDVADAVKVFENAESELSELSETADVPGDTLAADGLDERLLSLGRDLEAAMARTVELRARSGSLQSELRKLAGNDDARPGTPEFLAYQARRRVIAERIGYDAAYAEWNDYEEEVLAPLLRTILTSTATTPEGLAVQAKALAWDMDPRHGLVPDEPVDDDDYIGRVTRQFLEGVVRVGAAPSRAAA